MLSAQLQEPVEGVRTAGCFSADRHREADGPAQKLGRRPGDQILDLFHAKENAGNNIIVNAIAPGYCASSINYQDVEKNAFDERSRIKRIITPEDIAELATFLLSKAANGIVGQVITCDGGATL